MPNKELGIADPVYDALRIRSGQSIAPDLGGGSTGTGGLENKIYVWHADGSTIDTFNPDAAGLALAIAAAASGDTIWLPSIAIALTAGITIPAGVTLRGISEGAVLSFSGFSGDAATLSSLSVLQDCAVNFNGTGYATARGVVASGVGCNVTNCAISAASATTNIAIELTGANATFPANLLNVYAQANGGTTAIGIRVNDFVHSEHSFSVAEGAATRNSGVAFVCTSAANAGWFITGYGLSSTAGSAGMEVETNKYANIVDGFARGIACGLLIGAGATALVFALQWSSLCNSGTLTLLPGSGTGSGVGSGNTPDWFNVQAYGATGNGVTDDTAAIQATINAAAAAGGGVVYFPSGVYIVAGARQDGARGNAQLLMPARHLDNDTSIAITLLGGPIANQNTWDTTTGDPAGGSIIRSTLTTSTGGALLGGWGPAGSYADFTFVTLQIENLTFETPSNPVITALDLSHIASVDLVNLSINAGGIYGYRDIVQPTTATSYGIRMPQNVNDAQNTIRGAVTVMGFYNGVEITEHTNAEQLNIFACLYATKHPFAGHSIWISRLLIQWCAHGLTFTGAQHILIGLLNFEHANPGLFGAAWNDPIDDISDASNYAIGHTTWHATIAGTGVDDPIVIVGAANFQAISIHNFSGTVTSITAGTGLTATPNPIVATGTIALDAALNDLNDVDTSGTGAGDVIYNSGAGWVDYPFGIGSKVSVSGTKIRFGNVTGGNYLEIDSITGTLRLAGDATTYDDFRVEASVIKPGATAPNWKAFGPSGNLQALMFEASHHDEAYFELQMPHTWKLGTNLYPHVHWTPVNTTAGNVVWELEYAWANIGDAYGAPSNMATDPTAAGGVAWVHKLTDFKSGGNNYIDGTGKTLSSMLICRLHRNSNAGSDTLNQDVALLEVDFHYQIDSLGSDEPLVKDASASLLLETGDILLLETGDRLLTE